MEDSPLIEIYNPNICYKFNNISYKCTLQYKNVEFEPKLVEFDLVPRNHPNLQFLSYRCWIIVA